MNARHHPPDIAEQAAEWMVLLTCEDAAERARADRGFAAWKAADPLHAQAAARIERFVAQVRDVRQTTFNDPRPARAALDAAYASKKRRRSTWQAGTALAVTLVIASGIWFSGAVPPMAFLQADIRSSERQWIEQTLPDGTRLTLSGASAVKLNFDDTRRTVELLGGDIRVDVAKDASRPFYVETPTARIRALGTRFAVSYANGTTDLDMFESQVVVETVPASPDRRPTRTVVREGERVQVGLGAIGTVQALAATRVEKGLEQRQLILQDRPLPDVLAQLARHRPGGIRYDSMELQALRVSGVLPLDKPDDALRLLQTSFPELRLRFLASRWVWVDLQAETKKQ